MEETESDCLLPKALISSRKVDSSQETRHASGVAQKQSLRTQVSFLASPQQPVEVCRGGGMSTTTEMVLAEEENAQTSADNASDHHSPDAVQQHASPSQRNRQNTSCSNREEDYRVATQKPEAEQDEKRDVDGKSTAPRYGTGLPPAGTDDSIGKQLQFPDIASISNMPFQCFTNEGLACVQSCVEIDPYVDRHEQ